MTLSEIRALLEAEGIQLTKSLGQHFMHDANQLRRLAETAALTPADHILEVGPGLGPLTEYLLASGGDVTAVEMDRRLAACLRRRFGAESRFSLIEGDALAFLREQSRDWTDWKLVSNLPYSVGSSILAELALGPTCPSLMVVTLQLEVAERLIAPPRGEEYGILTLLIGQRYKPTLSFKIKPGSFFPPPRVASACVRLVRRAHPVVTDDLRPTFTHLVKTAFSQRRKQMRKLLGQRWPLERIDAAYAQLQLAPTARAEELSLDQFAAMTRVLAAPA